LDGYKMRGAVNVKSIIVLVIILLVGVLGVLGINTARTYMSSAAADTAPKNVLVKPLADGKGAVVSWASDKASMGVVEYGTTPASLLLRAVEAESVADHRVTLTPLKPGANYYFRIRVGEEVFDNNGIPYSFKTLASVEPTVTPTVAVPTMPVASSSAVSANACVIGATFNGKKIANSLDVIECLKVLPKTSAAPTSKPSACSIGATFNGKKITNGLDVIECLKSSKE